MAFYKVYLNVVKIFMYKKYIKVSITILFSFFFCFYFKNNSEDFYRVTRIPLYYLMIMITFVSLGLFLNGFFIKIILKNFDKKLTTLESFYVSIISSLGNYFLPMRGGAAIRSVYLKKKFDFSYSLFISTLYGNYIIVFLINSFLALISLLLIQFKFGLVSTVLYIFFIFLFVTMMLLAFIKISIKDSDVHKNNFTNKIITIIKNIIKGWNLIIENKKLMSSLILLTFGNFLISTILFLIEFETLGINSSLVNIVLYNCLSGVSLLVSLTPGSLGIREGLFFLTSNILKIDNKQIMQLALLDRSLIIITLVIWFIIINFVNNFKIKDD